MPDGVHARMRDDGVWKAGEGEGERMAVRLRQNPDRALFVLEHVPAGLNRGGFTEAGQ
jgi:hypothetical protein